MRISEVGEFGLIDRLKAVLGSEEIGDDCAIVAFDQKNLLLTTDALVEDIHFLGKIAPEALGWKAVSVNVSDIVSCGGAPLYLLVSLIIPDVDTRWVERLYEGIRKACEFYGCRVVGGNISRGEKKTIDVFALGWALKPVLRSGAKPGETLFVSGTLGDSRAGLELLKEGKKEYRSYELKLIERHTRPSARVDYIKHLEKYASSCIDISDGLLQDAGHIAKRSGVALEIDPKSIPISEELKAFCEDRGRDPLEYALRGGEDYQLLFTHPRKDQNPFLDMTPIGEVREGKGVFVEGREAEGGFSHF